MRKPSNHSRALKIWDQKAKDELKEKRKKYHKNYYQKNRKRLLERQKNYEKQRRKKLEQIKPIMKHLCKGLIPKKNFYGFIRQTGEFKVYFD